ncbi:MAG: hypothetical protein J6M16_01320 [Clostridia bacterium]|nr:hypothetical protein [Clostridia bacterium]
MKKYKKQIIILAAVVVVLGAVMAALLLTAPEKQENTNTPSTAETYTIINKSDLSVTSLSIDNPSSKYVININEEENDDGSISTVYEVPGYEGINFKTSGFEAAANVFLKYSATKEIGEVENLEEFGLKGENASTVTATYSDGSKETLVIGLPAGESSGKYILHNGKVYIGLINVLFASDISAQVSIPSWDIGPYYEYDGTETYNFEKFNLTGTNFPRDINIYYDTKKFEYYMTKPIACYGGYSFIGELSDYLISFTAGTVVDVLPEEAELEAYGLNEPYAELDFSLNGVAHKITVGNKIDNTKRYVLIDGNRNVVYGTYIDHISKWTESKELDYRDTYASIVFIYDVDKFTVEANGIKLVCDMERTLNSDRTTDTTKSYDYTCKVNGTAVDYKEITEFYGTVIGVPLLNMTDSDNDGETVLKITYEFYEDEKREDLVIEYQGCKSNSDRAAALIDGQYNVSVRMNAVKDVITAIENFNELVKGK